MNNLKKLLGVLHERSDALKWILRYVLFWFVLVPLVLWLTVPAPISKLGPAFIAYGASHALWVIYVLLRTLFFGLPMIGILAEVIISGKAMVPPAPAEPAPPVDVLINTAPDKGTHSTSQQVRLSVPDFLKHIEYNGHTFTESDIDYFLKQCKSKGHEPARMALLNLRKRFTRATEEPSPTRVDFSVI